MFTILYCNRYNKRLHSYRRGFIVFITSKLNRLISYRNYVRIECPSLCVNRINGTKKKKKTYYRLRDSMNIIINNERVLNCLFDPANNIITFDQKNIIIVAFHDEYYYYVIIRIIAVPTLIINY